MTWKRYGLAVLEGNEPWEHNSVMSPHVLFDEEKVSFLMWYSGGSNVF
jgi:hypothetical protein